MKLKSDYIITFLFLMVVFIGFKLLYIFFNCKPTEPQSIKCVVDSVWLAPQASVVEPYPLYHFHTDCGVTTTSPSNAFKKGDTVKFITN